MLAWLKEDQIERKPNNNEKDSEIDPQARCINMTPSFIHRRNRAQDTGFGLVDHGKESGMGGFSVIDFQTVTALTGFVSS